MVPLECSIEIRSALLALAVVGALGCGGGRAHSGGGATDTDDPPMPSGSPESTLSPSTGQESQTNSDSDDPPDPPPLPTSPTANLRFKGPQRLANDLGQTLVLDIDEVCTELDGLSCTGEVHAVTLGGVEPWHLGIYVPAPTSAVTSPIAVDRVVLKACIARVDLDFSGSPAVFDLNLSGAGLSDINDASVEAALDSIYTAGVLRHPDPTELDGLRDLYTDIVATGTAAPARDWAVAACFATLTTAEFLFY